MKTIGQIIEEARNGKKYSLAHVEGLTKIKTSFIDAIEKEDWNLLPAFPTVLGFVKSLADVLSLDQNMAVAVLKRDYPPKKLRINPKPDVPSKLTWSPKLTFIIGTAAITIVILGYLIFQYIRFISPPFLSVESPKEGQQVSIGTILVFGNTDTDTKVTVNNQPVIVDENGKFSTSLEVSADTSEVTITSSSRSGKTTIVTRKINVQ